MYMYMCINFSARFARYFNLEFASNMFESCNTYRSMYRS